VPLPRGFNGEWTQGFRFYITYWSGSLLSNEFLTARVIALAMGRKALH